MSYQYIELLNFDIVKPDRFQYTAFIRAKDKLYLIGFKDESFEEWFFSLNLIPLFCTQTL